jgi:enterochelin esterase family protein
MKTHATLPILLLLSAGTGFAAEAPGATPAFTNAAAAFRRPPPVRSPEVQGDRHVTFRLQADKADEVWVSGQWPNGRSAMTKGSNDVWIVTVGPIEPGVWEYSFQVDGLAMIDPLNPGIKPMREPRTSILHLPSEPPALHDFQNVPHGIVRQHSYFSKSLERRRELVVYTPPGYDQKAREKYPTLYLQHGSGDNQATWTTHGKAHWILDNLIAQGHAKPMIVVMMDGHAAVAGGSAAMTNNTPMFESDLLEDVLPFIEANYRVKPGSANRAIVGLSMGGGQSLTIGLNHLDRFGWVGGFSASVPRAETVASALENPEATNKKLKLLWIGCGKDDFLLKRNEEFLATLKSKNIRYEWHLTEGTHSWPIWRIYLGQFLPRLF